MDDSVTNSARAAAAQLLTAKRDTLVAERTQLLEQRSELLKRLRRIDREISDCRAAARVFQLDIEFPLDEHEEMERDLMQRQRERNRVAHERASVVFAAERDRPLYLGRLAVGDGKTPLEPQAEVVEEARSGAPANDGVIPEPPLAEVPPLAQSRPTLREVALEQLKIAGEVGVKAAPIREYFERTYGQAIHEKTVGMTLYRLSKEGLARRDGHVWFFVPPNAETKNPGGDAPGSNGVFG